MAKHAPSLSAFVDWLAWLDGKPEGERLKREELALAKVISLMNRLPAKAPDGEDRGEEAGAGGEEKEKAG